MEILNLPNPYITIEKNHQPPDSAIYGIKSKKKKHTFFWSMEFHIKFIQSIINCFNTVVTHHPG